MNGTTELLGLSDEVYRRTASRLDGLTDDEHLWEPASLCWSVRTRDDGEVRADWAPLPDDPPLTTIAWRLWHLTACYGQARNELLLRGAAGLGGDEREAPRVRAAEAVDALAAAHDWWRALLTSLSEDELSEPMGPVAGPYAEQTRAAFVLHQLDEQIHHAAEIALMRDLYAASVTGASNRRTAAVTELLSGRRPAGDDVDQVRKERPDLLRSAAANGHWRAVPLLVESGFDVGASRDGATALHHAAAAGEAAVARLLIAHGADPSQADDTFHAPPAGWAEFYGRTALAAEMADAATPA